MRNGSAYVLILASGWLFLSLGTSAMAQQPFALPAKVADSVELTADIPYAETDNPRQTLDLLLPRERTDKPLPVVVSVHGGAWRHGDKRRSVPRLAKLVAEGDYAAASIGYRLSGEAIWPAQIHDCKAAIRWIRANAEKYNLDADRIAVWGTSAGGHLVAMLGTSADVEAMDGKLGPHADVSSRVHCVVDFFGPTDLLRMPEMALPESQFDHDGPNSPESVLLGGPMKEHPEKAATANPITYVTADDAPTLLVHGTRDMLVPHGQSELLHEALDKVQVDSTLITVEGGGHGQNFGPTVTDVVREFLAHHLLGRQSEWQDRTIPAGE